MQFLMQSPYGNPCGFVEYEDVLVHMYNLHRHIVLCQASQFSSFIRAKIRDVAFTKGVNYGLEAKNSG
mgnify:CR=1 FL=1